MNGESVFLLAEAVAEWELKEVLLEWPGSGLESPRGLSSLSVPGDSIHSICTSSFLVLWSENFSSFQESLHPYF